MVDDALKRDPPLCLDRDLDVAMAKATDFRNAEKAKNTETIADSKVAQTAVECWRRP